MQIQNEEHNFNQQPVIDKLVEKMTLLKKNFLINHYEVTESRNTSVLTEMEQNEEMNEEDKSVSTDVSIYEIVGDLQQGQNQLIQQDQFDEYNYHYNQYLRTLTKYFNQIRNYILNSKLKLGIRYTNLFIELFVKNYVLIQEIHTFFKFMGSLINFKKRSHSITEESFLKFFYEILLRVDCTCIDQEIYTVIEMFIFYINVRLKIIELNIFEINRIEMIYSNIIGFDFIVEIFISTQDEDVKKKSLNTLINIFRAQLTQKIEQVDQISCYYYNFLYENLFEYYNKLISTNCKKKLIGILELIQFYIEEAFEQRSNIISQIGFKENLQLIILDQRFPSNQNPSRVVLKVSSQEKLISLKNKIKLRFWDLPAFNLLTKGKFLQDDQKSLKELNIQNNQTLRIIEINEEEENQFKKMKKEENLKQINEIFPDLEKDFTVFVINKYQNEIEEILLQLSNPQQIIQLKNEFNKQQGYTEKVSFTEKNLKSQIILRFCSQEFYQILFSIEKVQDQQINQQVWSLIQILPPNQQLIQNIENKIKQLKKYCLNDLDNIFKNQQQLNQKKCEDYFTFKIDNILSNLSIFNIYKLGLLIDLIQIFKKKNEYISLKKFKLQLSFLQNGGIDLLLMLLKNFSNSIKKNNQNQFHFQIFQKIIQALLGFFIAQKCLKQNEPIKVAKKTLQKRAQYLNQEFMGLKKSHSENVFLQNQSFKTNKSPKSVVTANFTFGSPNISRSISQQSNSQLPKSVQDKDDNSFSIQTNMSNQSNRIDQMQNFLKQYLKQKQKNKQVEINDIILGEDQKFQILFDEIKCILSQFLQNKNFTEHNFIVQIQDCFFLMLEINTEFLQNIEFQLIENFMNYLQQLQPVERNEVTKQQYVYFFQFFEIENLNRKITRNYLERLLDNIIYMIQKEQALTSNQLILVEKLFTLQKDIDIHILQQKVQSIFPNMYVITCQKLIKSFEDSNNLYNDIFSSNLFLLYIFVKLKLFQFENDHEVLLDQIIQNLFQKIFSIEYKNNKPQMFSERDRKYTLLFLEVSSKINLDRAFQNLLFLSQMNQKELIQYKQTANFSLRDQKQFVGLKNLRNTCYLNSVIQQLFMIDEFKSCILNNQYKNDVKFDYEKIYYQTRILFAQLERTIFSYIVPIQFCQDFTAFDGQPINNFTQQDANEFFNLFIDKIDQFLQKQQSNQLQGLFKGVLINQIQSIEEEYKFEKNSEEIFINIPLNIKNNRSLINAIDEFTKGHVLDGDNKYFCEEYNSKIKVEKKYKFKKLPQYLTFTLNRFEFNPQTGQRSKLNDYFEFPFELNMQKWSETEDEIENQFCAENDKKEQINNEIMEKNQILVEDIDQKSQKNSWIYKLVGVVVHSGIAESGHYYSYIKKNGKWYQFNDTYIREVKIDTKITFEEWFGGKEQENMFNVNEFAFNLGRKNAYMLFYQQTPEIAQNKIKIKLDQQTEQIVKQMDNRIQLFQLQTDPDFSKFLKELDFYLSSQEEEFLKCYIISLEEQTQQKVENFINQNMPLTRKLYFGNISVQQPQSPFNLSFNDAIAGQGSIKNSIQAVDFNDSRDDMNFSNNSFNVNLLTSGDKDEKDVQNEGNILDKL